MAVSFLDKIYGQFYNGMEIKDVPSSLHTYYSIHGYLSRILNNTFEIDPVNQLFYGSLNLFSVHTEVPANVKELSRALRDYIKKASNWDFEIKVGGWEVDKKAAHLQCIVFCIQPDKDVYKFRVKFIARGAVHIKTWSNISG